MFNRDVTCVELLVNNHRSIKAEIDAREENFSICLSLGRALLIRRHPRENDIREKCIEVVTNGVNLNDQWTERWDYLHLILEVYQFAKDAAVAESWLLSQSTLLSCQDLGENLDETLALLKKHIAFEKAAIAQEERFEALKKLTTLEIRARETLPEAQKIKYENHQKKIKANIKEFERPVTTKQEPVKFGNIEPEVTHMPPHQASSSSSEKISEQPITRKKSSMSREISSECQEGLLMRKHEWENATKKASGRSWHELYFVICDNSLSTYKDSRHYKEKPSDLYHHETPLSLLGSCAAPASDYSKRPNVFRLRLANGGEFLFQAKSESEMNDWISRMNSVAGDPDSGEQRFSLLPAQVAGSSEGKKKFFTLGRKK